MREHTMGEESWGETEIPECWVFCTRSLVYLTSSSHSPFVNEKMEAQGGCLIKFQTSK